MRWLMAALTVIGFAIAFVAGSVGLLAIGIVLGFIGLFGTVFAIAAARVSATSRPDAAMASADVLAVLGTPRGARPTGSVPPAPSVPPAARIATPPPPRDDRIPR
jgi:hypothetical protein